MRIGELAKVTGTAVETIRFYEREGLIESARTDNNYRRYTPAQAERLSFILHCRNLDMTLDEIRALLHLRDTPSKDCGEVNTLLDEHIGHVSRRIDELRALERHLKELRARCNSPHRVDECAILSGLDDHAPREARQPRSRHVRGAH